MAGLPGTTETLEACAALVVAVASVVAGWRAKRQREE